MSESEDKQGDERSHLNSEGTNDDVFCEEDVYVEVPPPPDGGIFFFDFNLAENV